MLAVMVPRCCETGRKQCRWLLRARKIPVTTLWFRDHGLEEFRQWFFFLLGRGAAGEALLTGEPTWQGWDSPGLRVEQDAPCQPLLLPFFWPPLGLDP